MLAGRRSKTRRFQRRSRFCACVWGREASSASSTTATKFLNVGAGQCTCAAPWNQPGVGEEDDAGDHDLREPAGDEEEGREQDPPEAELRQADGVREAEDVPGDPEDERCEQRQGDDRRDRDGDAADHEAADPGDAEQEPGSLAHSGSRGPGSSRNGG